ncbi:MAG: F0F1 ATP synthase subunit A [Maricaulaceae bacterium]
MADNPLEQFQVHPVVELPQIGGVDLSITNAAAHMMLAVLVILVVLNIAISKASLVPGRLQSIAELMYEFIAGMIRDIVGPEGMRFFPYVFTLFIFILTANMLGMFSIFFTTTSHVAVTLSLALLTITIVIITGLVRHGFGFFKLFAPSGLPLPLYILITPIEIISFLARPITLAVRLFANMLAGHVMLKIFGIFVISLGGLGGAAALSALLPLGAAFAITGLEFLVAFLQAYVFAILTVIYLNDVVHMHH